MQNDIEKSIIYLSYLIIKIMTLLKQQTEWFISICWWCPDKEEEEKKAEVKWIPVSHGICDECFRVQMSTLDILENNSDVWLTQEK